MLALGLALATGPACGRAAPAPELQAAAPPRADAPTLAAPATSGPESVDHLLEEAAAGRDGDGLPARLAAMLELDDASVGPAIAFARAGQGSKLVIDALATAGTSAAQSGLARIARDPALPGRVRTEAVAALVLLRNPEPPALDAVRTLIGARDPALRHAALFVAGALARARREHAPGATTALERQVLVACAHTASGSVDDRLDALAALGNLGTPAILSQVQAAAASPDPRVRAAAVRALRFVAAPEADRTLLATLRRDRDATVRAAAIFAAGFRPLPPLAAGLAETAENDPADFVRADAVRLLARHPDASERVARALRYVARNDPAPDVRRLAEDGGGAP
jgi:HEAT repeat protein